MKPLIIGGRGFIGSRLLKRLPDADVIDLRDGHDACKVLPGRTAAYSVVYHVAATIRPVDDRDIVLHRTVVEYARRHEVHLVYTSSAAVYEPVDLYGVQKLYGEVLVRTLASYTILRLFNVYGGGHGIVDKIKRGQHVTITGDGTQTRDFVHVDDVVDALLLAPTHRGIFDVGTGRATAINDLLEKPEYNGGDPGVLRSCANLDPAFPWRPKKDVADYLMKATIANV